MSRKTDGLTKIELDQMRCLSETLDDGWLRTDEWIETVLDFEMFSEQLGQVTFDPHRWIWAIIALHRGIQGMMVLALKGSNDFKVLREKDVERWLSWYEDDRGDESPPHAKLADFLDLYRKIKGDKMLIYMHSQKFVPKGTQDFSIKHLHRLRNKIIHFKPQIWSLELKGLPAMVLDCLKIAEFLAWKSGNVIWHNYDLRKRLKAACACARKSLADIDKEKPQ